jgi:hypothetical protein
VFSKVESSNFTLILFTVKKIIQHISNWEAWPFKLLYTPIALFWLGYIIKSRAIWFFTPSNPKLTFGGMEGEPKKEMYDLLSKDAYPTTINILPGEAFHLVDIKIKQAGLSYPFIVKPEVGGQGILFRVIENETHLKHYHTLMPWEYMAQALVTYPMEVSVFYIRHPQSSKGTVTGFLHKIPLQVTGDGVHSLAELVSMHPKGEKRVEEMHIKHEANWNRVLNQGEKYMLSYAANHNRGARFVDLKAHIDEKLVAVFDDISLSINDFFYGRYDIMTTSVEDLKAGKNFTILEYNGCGAEPNHFYDTGYTLLGAYKEILKHWRALYEISAYNAKQGIQPWPTQKGRKFLKYTRDLMAEMKVVDLKIG